MTLSAVDSRSTRDILGDGSHHANDIVRTGPVAVAPEPSSELVAGLARAVAADDPQTFVRIIDGLLGGPVRLLDADARTVADSRAAERAGRACPPGHEMALDVDGAVVGTLEIPRGCWWNVEEAQPARTLAVILLRQRRLGAEIDELRHHVTLADLLAPESASGRAIRTGRTVTPPAACRPVIVSMPAGQSPGGGRTWARPVRSACAEHAELQTICLVPVDDGLLGVYTAPGSTDPAAHAGAWHAVLDTVGWSGAAVSVGHGAGSPEDLRASLSVTRMVADLQRRGASYLGVPRVAVNEQLGPLSSVLTAVSGDQIPSFVERVLGDLLTYDRFGGELMDTLHAYLTTSGSPQEAGRLLHLHPSSVKYRMRVIRDLLGPRLDDPQQRFDLELAVRLYLATRELAGTKATTRS